MKRASIYDRMQSAGASARAPSTPREDHAKRSGLGPRGQGLFERLFGTSRTTTQPAPEACREAPVVAIASGKGGTGKSFVSTSLAVGLHRAGHRTTLVDCDFGLACDHLLLGVKPGTHLQHVVQGRLPVGDVRVQTEHGPGLVPGVTGVRQMKQLQDHEMRQFGEALGQLAAEDDCVLLDTGAGLSPQTVLTLCAADHVVLVTQPEIAALTDAYAVLKTLAQVRSDVSLSVIVNRVIEDGHGEATFEKLQDVAARNTGVELTFLGSIPDDPLVTQRRLGQPPLVVSHPEHPTAVRVLEIADHMARLFGPLGPRERAPGQGVAPRLLAHQRLV
jgi:flagellar biosynthesis protein FlhG